MARKKNGSKKVEIVFDPKKRREFLTGFTKRKNERKKKAREQLDRTLKEEHKLIRQELKESFKHMKKTFEPLRELTEEDKREEEYEDDKVKVKIIELSTNDLVKKGNMLGINNEESSEEENEAEAESEGGINEASEIPGMDYVVKSNELKSNKKLNRSKFKDRENADSVSNTKSNQLEVKSKKEIDRLMKTKTLKEMRKSKAFKMKERFEKKANQKRSRRDKNNMIRSLPRHLQKNTKKEKCRYRKGRMIGKKEMRRKK